MEENDAGMPPPRETEDTAGVQETPQTSPSRPTPVFLRKPTFGQLMSTACLVVGVCLALLGVFDCMRFGEPPRKPWLVPVGAGMLVLRWIARKVREELLM